MQCPDSDATRTAGSGEPHFTPTPLEICCGEIQILWPQRGPLLLVSVEEKHGTAVDLIHYHGCA